MLYTNRVKSPYSYMPWSNYEVKRRKRENRNVNVIEKKGAEKIVADQFNPNHNLAKIW